MHRRLTQRQIEAFRGVMLRGSISGAAEMLGLTQPAVSRLMRDMQEILQLRLFEPRGNGIVPNAEANLLFGEVQQSFVGLDRIEHTAHEIKRARRGNLRIIAMAGPAHGILPRLVARFLRDHPDTYVALHNHIAPTVLERVALRQFDFGIAYAPADYPGLDIEPLPRLDAVCVLPASHPLAARPVIRPEDLHEQNLINHGARSHIAVKLDAMLRIAGVMVRELAEATSAEVLCRLVGQGVGIALLDPFTVTALRDPAIVLRRFEPRVDYPVALVFPSGMARSRTVEEFTAVLRQEATMSRLLPDLTG
jgi:DNA-binding transcriptional LysR family regulator